MNDPVKDEVGHARIEGCRHDADRGHDRPGATFCGQTGDFLRRQDYELSLRIEFAQFGSVVSGREAECDGPRLGQRAGAGQSGDAVPQPAAHLHGLLLFRRERPGRSTLPMSQWIHVVHTYQQGDSRVYVNGILDGASTNTAAPLAIKSPARMWIGGWYNNYDFIGDYRRGAHFQGGAFGRLGEAAIREPEAAANAGGARGAVRAARFPFRRRGSTCWKGRA